MFIHNKIEISSNIYLFYIILQINNYFYSKVRLYIVYNINNNIS